MYFSEVTSSTCFGKEKDKLKISRACKFDIRTLQIPAYRVPHLLVVISDFCPTKPAVFDVVCSVTGTIFTFKCALPTISQANFTHTRRLDRIFLVM